MSHCTAGLSVAGAAVEFQFKVLLLFRDECHGSLVARCQTHIREQAIADAWNALEERATWRKCRKGVVQIAKHLIQVIRARFMPKAMPAPVEQLLCGQYGEGRAGEEGQYARDDGVQLDIGGQALEIDEPPAADIKQPPVVQYELLTDGINAFHNMAPFYGLTPRGCASRAVLQRVCYGLLAME